MDNHRRKPKKEAKRSARSATIRKSSNHGKSNSHTSAGDNNHDDRKGRDSRQISGANSPAEQTLFNVCHEEGFDDMRSKFTSFSLGTDQHHIEDRAKRLRKAQRKQSRSAPADYTKQRRTCLNSHSSERTLNLNLEDYLQQQQQQQVQQPQIVFQDASSGGGSDDGVVAQQQNNIEKNVKQGISLSRLKGPAISQQERVRSAPLPRITGSSSSISRSIIGRSNRDKTGTSLLSKKFSFSNLDPIRPIGSGGPSQQIVLGSPGKKDRVKGSARSNNAKWQRKSSLAMTGTKVN